MMWAGYWWVVRSDFGEAGARMERLRGGKRPTGQFQNISRGSLDFAKADHRLVAPETSDKAG